MFKNNLEEDESTYWGNQEDIEKECGGDKQETKLDPYDKKWKIREEIIENPKIWSTPQGKQREWRGEQKANWGTNKVEPCHN